MRKLQQLLESASRHIAVHVAKVHDASQKLALQQAWDASRSMLAAELTSKLGFWQHLPWLLMGLASNHDLTTKHVATRALWLFDNKFSGWQHLQSRRFLDASFSGLRNDETPLRPIASRLY